MYQRAVRHERSRRAPSRIFEALARRARAMLPQGRPFSSTNHSSPDRLSAVTGEEPCPPRLSNEGLGLCRLICRYRYTQRRLTLGTHHSEFDDEHLQA